MKRDKNRKLRQLILKNTEGKEQASQEEIRKLASSFKNLFNEWDRKDSEKNE